MTTMKVDPAGIQQWGTKGRQVAVGPDFLGNPKITATSDGAAAAGWIEGNNLMFQRISPTGQRLWGQSVITIVAPAGLTYWLADFHAADDGSVIASWVSAAAFSGPKDLLANKNGADGPLIWGAAHVTVFGGGSLQFGNLPPFVT